MESKNFNGKKNTILAIPIFLILIIFIVVLVVAIAREGALEEMAEATATAQVTETEAAETTDAPESTVAPATETTTPEATATVAPATATATANATAKATAASADGTPVPISGSAKIIDPEDIDYSFLDGVPTDNFEDADGDSYDWYPGKVTYLNGTVTYVWDRYSSTLSWLKKYNGVYRQNESEKVIYLTFDCGYENGNTEKILDVLKEKDCDGIFFVTGDYVDSTDNQRIMKRMLDEGNLIGSHTENHKIMPTLSNEEFVSELNTVYAKMKKIFGDDFTWSYYRPPQGASSPRDLALANYLGYKTTFWAFAYADYNPDNQPTHEAALTAMKSSLHPGAVYLLHAVSQTNAEVLGEFIDWVRSEGYEIRRIDQ